VKDHRKGAWQQKKKRYFGRLKMRESFKIIIHDEAKEEEKTEKS
jgi:hypothetical protein